jgi:hypothetical protein
VAERLKSLFCAVDVCEYVCVFTRVDIGSFAEMAVKIVMMDDVLADPEGTPRNAVTIVEVKRLSDIKRALSEGGIADALAMVEETSHPRLWTLIADASLGALDLDMAGKAFIRAVDYSGLLFCKTLKKIEVNTLVLSYPNTRTGANNKPKSHPTFPTTTSRRNYT